MVAIEKCQWCGRWAGCTCAVDLSSAFDWQDDAQPYDADADRSDVDRLADLGAHPSYPDDGDPTA